MNSTQGARAWSHTPRSLGPRKHIEDRGRYLSINPAAPGFRGDLFEAADLWAIFEIVDRVLARFDLKQKVGSEVLTEFDYVWRG